MEIGRSHVRLMNSKLQTIREQLWLMKFIQPDSSFMDAQNTPTVAGKKLSSSLKQRLKSCGRYHASPLATVTKGSPSSYRFESSGKQIHTSQVHAPSAVTPSSSISDGKNNSDTSVTESLTLTPDVTLTLTSTPLQRSMPFNTPVTVKSRSSIGIVKGSKLDFNKSTDHVESDEQSEIKDQEDDLEKPDSSVSVPVLSENLEMNSDAPDCLSFVDEKTFMLLKKQLKEREEDLRKLKMVKMYREKNNLTKLGSLIEKWRSVTQDALKDLQQSLPEPRPHLSELVNHLQIDPQQVQYDADSDSFY